MVVYILASLLVITVALYGVYRLYIGGKGNASSKAADKEHYTFKL